MAAQLSREVLQKVVDAADAVISALAGENEDVHKDDSTKICRLWDELNDKYAPPEIVRVMARMLLAGMDSKPVAKVETVGVCWYADNGVPRKPAVGAALYAAPPAPVAVPEDFEDWAKDEGLIQESHGMRFVNSATDVARKAWNAAMLKAGPVTAATVPDGWKLVPVEPTAEMCKAGYEAQDKWPSEQCDNFKERRYSFSQPRYKAMLAAAPAAPEREV